MLCVCNGGHSIQKSRLTSYHMIEKKIGLMAVQRSTCIAAEASAIHYMVARTCIHRDVLYIPAFHWRESGGSLREG